MMRFQLLIAVSLALCSMIYGYPTMLAPVVSSNTSNHACTKDSDCPGNYCMDGPDKTPPYSCHDDPTPTPPTPPPPAPTDAPNCTQAGQDDLCKVACESTCRSFQPGFKAAGCADEKYCTNPPAWAKGSVCNCPAAIPVAFDICDPTGFVHAMGTDGNDKGKCLEIAFGGGKGQSHFWQKDGWKYSTNKVWSDGKCDLTAFPTVSSFTKDFGGWTAATNSDQVPSCGNVNFTKFNPTAVTVELEA